MRRVGTPSSLPKSFISKRYMKGERLDPKVQIESSFCMSPTFWIRQQEVFGVKPFFLFHRISVTDQKCHFHFHGFPS